VLRLRADPPGGDALSAPRCRYCKCILRAEETRSRGYCRFRSCLAEAAEDAATSPTPAVAEAAEPLPAPGTSWTMVRGESSRRERWAVGRVRMTRTRWLLEPEEYRAFHPARVLRLDESGASTLYPVDVVDDEEALAPIKEEPVSKGPRRAGLEF
jgi:hypothetical protein